MKVFHSIERVWRRYDGLKSFIAGVLLGLRVTIHFFLSPDAIVEKIMFEESSESKCTIIMSPFDPASIMYVETIWSLKYLH